MEEEFYGIPNERIVEEQNISLSSINVSKKLISALEIAIKSKYITLAELVVIVHLSITFICTFKACSNG